MHTPLTLLPRMHDLGGGFVVRRLLPAARCAAVGPFVFFDHFGPVQAQPGDNHDVRPHPHIGIATVTYLFEGMLEHRDSTGARQCIAPGALNWMTAGRGIVHSERTPAALRQQPRSVHGLQLWMALPQADEECAPGFVHIPASDLPRVELPGAQVTVLAGSAWGAHSPAPARSPTLYLDIQLAPGAVLPLPADYPERGVYALDAACQLDGQDLPACQMVVLVPGTTPHLQAREAARVVVIGGAPLGPRYLVWNFVARSRERLQQAREDWIAGRFPPIAGETEWIPYPEDRT